MAARSLALVTLGFSTNSRHWNKPKKKTVGAFSERPGKISSPLRQTVLSALHVAISCSVSSERALFFRGPFFFYSWPICHVSHMQVLYTLYTDLASKNLNYFSLFYSFLSFDVSAAILFIFYSNIRPAQLNSSYKRNQTLHLYVCVQVCVRVQVCVNGICACLQCAPRPFVVSFCSL